MNKKAFTLAEVLITLGIIGIVASMTIPNLMQKTNGKELASGTLKMGSVLSNALKGMEAQSMIGVEKISDLDTFNAAFATQLKTRTCDDHAICLADGSYFDYANENFGDVCNKSNPCVEIIVDVNGKKGPGKQGRDIYKFLVTSRGIQPAGETDTCTGLDCTAYVMSNHKLWDGELIEVPIEVEEDVEDALCGGNSRPEYECAYGQHFECQEEVWACVDD